MTDVAYAVAEGDLGRVEGRDGGWGGGEPGLGINIYVSGWGRELN